MKIIFSTIFLLALCSARITLPIKQSSDINPVNVPQKFLAADDEKSTSSPKNLKLTVNNHANLFYYADLYVGKNTTMGVLLETRTNNLWLPDLDFVPSLGKNQYNCSASLTCDQTKETQRLTYSLKDILGYTTTFIGNLGHEILGLTQDFKVRSSVLWVSDSSPNLFDDTRPYYYHDKIDGYMGLGSNESSDCYIDQAYEQNYIQEKVFSFHFDSIPPRRYGDDSNKSYLTVGYIPEDKVNKLTWLSIDSASPNSWTMPFSSVKIGNKVLDTSSDPFANKISLDSGAPHIMLPRSVFQEFNSQWQNTPFISIDDATYVICNDNYTDSYPKITFKFDGMDIVIDANTYLSFEDVEYYGNNVVYCRVLAVSSKTGAMPVLGSPFLRNHFVAFSKRNQTVGIHPEVKPIRFGNYKASFNFVITWFHVAGVVGLLLVIIVACCLRRNQKKAEKLKQALNENDCDVYQSRIGV